MPQLCCQSADAATESRLGVSERHRATRLFGTNRLGATKPFFKLIRANLGIAAVVEPSGLGAGMPRQQLRVLKATASRTKKRNAGGAKAVGADTATLAGKGRCPFDAL